MRRRGVPARSSSRSSATTSPSTARRASTASPSCRSARSTSVRPRLPGDERRRAGALRRGDDPAGRRPVRVASIYLPNGNPVGTDKFDYKLAWMDAAARPRRSACSPSRSRWCSPATTTSSRADDADDPADWADDALFQPESRAAFRALARTRLTDALRATAGGRLHLLGLSGRRLAEERRHPHRPPAAVAAGRRPARRPRSTATRAPGTSRPTTCR